jgi:beta-glucosidase
MNPVLERLVTEVASVQPRSVVVLTAGGNVDMSRWADRVQGVLHAFFPGQAGGQAVAEVLFGRVNPSGRLPATFEKRLEDRSSFDCYHDDDGDLRVRLSDGLYSGYRHFDRHGISPRYAFGHGLSYTRFELGELSLSSSEVSRGGALEASLDVTNAGDRAGDEVVQLYVAAVGSDVERPPKALAGFARVSLEPGETRRVRLQVPPRALETYDPERGDWVYRPGEYRVLCGETATSLPLSARFSAT